MELSPAQRVLGFLYDRLHVDVEWSVRGNRGFTWWAGELAQRIVASQSREVEGATIETLHIETDLLNDLQFGAQTASQVASLNRLATLSAYVLDRPAGALRLHASVSVTEDNWPLARGLALHAAVLQVCDAHAEAEPLAPVIGGRVATSAHPGGGARTTRDEMLEVIDTYRERGEDPSPFTADELASLVHAEPRPWSEASSNDSRIDAWLPWGEHKRAAMVIDGAVQHPAVGSGLHVALWLPEASNARTVERLNAAELVAPDAHQLGAWCVDDEHGLGFVSFVPAAAYLPNLVRALVYHFAARAQWATALLANGGP